MPSDFERFQREQQAARRATSDAEDDDIRREEAYERRHARMRRDQDGIKRPHTPIWRTTAGSFAQFLIVGLYWVLFGLLLFSTTSPGREQTLQTWLWLASLLPAIVLGVITWSVMGPAWRDRARMLVRVAPLLVIGGLAIAGRWFGKAERDHGVVTAAPSTATSAPPPPTSPTPPASVPDPSIADAAFDVGVGRVEAWWREGLRCGEQVRSARRVPHSGGRSLAEHLACVRDHERLRPDVERFAARHADALAAAVQSSSRSLGAILAAAHGPPTDSVGALVGLIDRAGLADEAALVEALTIAALRHPDVGGAALEAALSSPRAASRGTAARLTLATALARTARDPRAACAVIADVLLEVGTPTAPARDIQEAIRLGGRAERALDELAPRCTVVVDEALAVLAAAADTPATRSSEALWQLNARARLVGAGDLGHFARARAVLGAMNAQPGLTLAARTLADASEALGERAFERAVGLSPMVFNHAQSRALIAVEDVVLAPCDDATLGVVKKPKKGALPAPAPAWRPDCVVRHRAPEGLRAPLSLWRATLDGWNIDAWRAVTLAGSLKATPTQGPRQAAE